MGIPSLTLNSFHCPNFRKMHDNTTAAPPSAPVSSNLPTIPPHVQSFHNVLKHMLSAGDNVSDLIFSPGRPPQVELSGDLEGVNIPGLELLKPPHIKSFADIMLAGNDQGNESFDKKGSADISYGVPGLCRFRVNIFKQRGTHAIVMRVIPTNPPNWQDLDLPASVMN